MIAAKCVPALRMIDIWPALGFLASAATVWAVYHSRMLDKNFNADHSIFESEGRAVLAVKLTREKPGGPYGRIAGIKVASGSGVRLAPRVRKPATGAVGYGGESWEDPIFSKMAACDIPFSPSTRAMEASFWIDCNTATELRAVLMVEYKRSTVLARRIEIYAKPSELNASVATMTPK